MPAIVVAVAASAASIGATTALTAAIGATYAAVAGGVVGALVAGVAGSILAPKPKAGSDSLGIAAQESSYNTIVRSSVESQKLIYGKRRVSGTLVFVTTTKTAVMSELAVNSGAPTLITDTRDNAFLHMVIALAGHEIEAVDEVYLGDTLLTLNSDGFATNSPYQGSYINANGQDQGTWRFVRVKKYLGTDSQTADPDLQTVFSGWTANHRLQGVAYLYITMRWYDRVFPNGIPNVTAVVRGRKVYDPRSDATVYSSNWALCVRDYLTNSRFGLGCLATELDNANFIAQANLADETVTLLDGSTQARYTVNGVIDTSNEPMRVLDTMAAAAAGVITYSQGQFRCFAAAYDTPTITINEAWLRDVPNVQARTPRKERFNAVRGVYVEPTKLWQPTDYPAVVNTTYAADDGETIYRDLELQFVTNAEMAQRLARIYLEQQRRSITCTMPCNLMAMQVTVWDVVKVSIAQLGWVEKPFRVLAWRLSGTGGIDLDLKEDDSAVYSWTAANGQAMRTVPQTNLPSAFVVAAPGTPTVTEELYATNDGSGIKSRAVVSWGISSGPFVWRYRVEYKASTASDYLVAGETAADSFTVYDLAANTYDFRVKAINTVLAESEYVERTSVQLYGLTTPPVNVGGLTMNELKGSAHLQWDAATDLDVRVGGSVRVRHTRDIVSPSWSSSLDIGPVLSGITTNVVLPLLAGTYMVKFVDSTGNESTTATSIVNGITDLLNMNIVATKTESTAFAGTLTNMQVSGGALQLEAVGLFDTYTGLFDAATGLFDDALTGAGFVVSGSYTFAEIGGGNTAHIDLGQTYKSRATADIKFLVSNSVNTFDERDGDFDAATGMFDGGDTAGVDVKLFVRTTEDDPTSSPTWSAWRQFLVGDYTARAYQFKLEVNSTSTTFNLDITTLAVTVDVPERDERIDNVAVVSGGTTVTFTKPFYAKPGIGFIIQSPTGGETSEIVFNTSGGKYIGFVAKVYQSGSYINRTVDFLVRGY